MTWLRARHTTGFCCVAVKPKWFPLCGPGWRRWLAANRTNTQRPNIPYRFDAGGHFTRSAHRECLGIFFGAYPSVHFAVKRTTAPPPLAFSAQMRPPCASMIERQIASPSPSPLHLLVTRGSNILSNE